MLVSWSDTTRCGHCKRLAPTWDQLAEITHSKTGITVAKVNVANGYCNTVIRLIGGLHGREGVV